MNAYYEQLKKHDDVPACNTSLAMVASNALEDSDRYARYRDYEPDAMYGRYEFRDGAAHVLASVFGLDMDYARQVMQTHQAWADYEKANYEKDDTNEF